LNCHSIGTGDDAQIGAGSTSISRSSLNAAHEADLRLQATMSDSVDRVRSAGA
jgi:hypothetical protein